eukprot:CAMPEP_0182438130 /NCGR_PEP_ID=MMETSP1167-20130531/85521_1 /TAXON_ID=2988 /ORGANISM="Mallomonas Sp, Strain CCMP3275" /LENGTH=205 /DNA_ID=CAMNT_0024631329 /DNA_START=17 /DNA_END=631 /DNA_ORIENTATION=+
MDYGVYGYPLIASGVVFLSIALLVNIVKRMGNTAAVSTTSRDEKSSLSPKASKAPASAATEKSYPAGPMTVYFGSQTGTAEGYARTIVNDSKKLGFDAKLSDLEDFSPEDFMNKELCIFLLATYGEGEPTDNASKFQKWYKNEENKQCLKSIRYCIFGLGNRQYEHFNHMAVTTDKYLELLGGSREMETGLGDDDDNLEEDFEKW